MTNPKITDLKEGDKVRVEFVMEWDTRDENPNFAWSYIPPYVEGGPLSFHLTPEEAKSVRIERLDQ